MHPRRVLFGLVLLAGAGAAPIVGAAQEPLDARVEASRRVLRVIFPPDTHTTWGWTDTLANRFQPRYRWAILVDPPTGPRMVALQVGNGQPAARFPSLRAVVAAGEPVDCTGGMILVCTPIGAQISLDGRRVVVTVRDSSLIAELFGLRPDSVGMQVYGPSGAPEVRRTMPVEYVRPQLPEPDSTVLASAARARRQYLERISSIEREIRSSTRELTPAGPLWIVNGDSLPLAVMERRCRHDLCGVFSVRGATWSVDDTAVVRLGEEARAALRISTSRGGDGVLATAIAPGVTTIRVSLPALASDTMPSRMPPPRELAREVRVTPPIERVVISPRPESARLGDQVRFDVAAIDRSGASLPAPVALSVTGGRHAAEYRGPRVDVRFDTVGTWTLIARFGLHADTVRVRVERAP